MFKVEAVVNGDQLETLLLAAKVAGVKLELAGVILDEAPQRRTYRKRKRSTKTKKKRKVANSKMSVRLVQNSLVKLTPIEEKARSALMAEFGTDSFQRSLARGVLAKRAKMKHPSGYITRLSRKDILVPA